MSPYITTSRVRERECERSFLGLSEIGRHNTVLGSLAVKPT